MFISVVLNDSLPMKCMLKTEVIYRFLFQDAHAIKTCFRYVMFSFLPKNDRAKALAKINDKNKIDRSYLRLFVFEGKRDTLFQFNKTVDIDILTQRRRRLKGICFVVYFRCTMKE